MKKINLLVLLLALAGCATSPEQSQTHYSEATPLVAASARQVDAAERSTIRVDQRLMISNIDDEVFLVGEEPQALQVAPGAHQIELHPASGRAAIGYGLVFRSAPGETVYVKYLRKDGKIYIVASPDPAPLTELPAAAQPSARLARQVPVPGSTYANEDLQRRILAEIAGTLGCEDFRVREVEFVRQQGTVGVGYGGRLSYADLTEAWMLDGCGMEAAAVQVRIKARAGIIDLEIVPP